MKNLAIDVFCGSGTFSNLTKVKRQQTPQKLIKDILTQLEKYLDHK